MNISIFLKLHTAVKRGNVKLNSQYKHFDYMYDKGWISLIIDDVKSESEPGVFGIIPTYSEYVNITNEGKDVYFKARNSWIKWVLGTIISVSTAITAALLRMLLTG